MTNSQRITGSFRDPSGYVFWMGGRLYRGVNESCADVLTSLREGGLLDKLVADGLIVPTRFVESAEECESLRKAHPGFHAYLEHEVVDPITYPYEWSVSMLADAAVLTVNLQKRLLAKGYALKDATAFNIQFRGAKPVFIDLPSIERPKRLDIWYAMGQFQRMFIYPLLLCRHYGWDIPSYFLPSLDGRGLHEMARFLSPLQRLHPRLWMDVTLPLLVERKTDGKTQSGQEILGKKVVDTKPQEFMLDRLSSKVKSLAAGFRRQGVWVNYEATCTYTSAATDAKKELVRRFIRELKPKTVLDLGCNAGDYSFVAEECGARVIAVDSDHDVVDILYQRVRGKETAITPMVANVCQPSPGLGFRNEERSRLADRVKSDCVIALALLHHLLVSGNLSLRAACDLLSDFTHDALVLEFVPVDDPMFQKLTKFRTTEFNDVTLESCLSAFSKDFTVESVEQVPGLDRHLLFLRKRNS